MYNTEFDKRSAKVADLILNEFIRLEISTNDDPCSGLMASVANVVTSEVLVNVYDDNASGIYEGEELLSYLQKLESTDLDQIWSQISKFEV